MARRPRIRRVRRVYRSIKDQGGEFDVTTMRPVLNVARAGYYAWLQEPLSDRAKEDAGLLTLISRKIIGWAAASTLHRDLVLDAVIKAVRSQRPKQAVIHSDQTSHDGRGDWRRFCRTSRLEPSMSGYCWDNAKCA